MRVLAKSRGSVGETANPGPDIHRLLWYKEGPTATVSVRDDWGIRSMAVNGRTNASDRDDMPTQVILGQLAILLAPRTDVGLDRRLRLRRLLSARCCNRKSNRSNASN